ncbi:MAG: Ldh family oxidoreductase [Rhodoferax sp.]|nr:Ldh family oxidoreductase [Rhodoferax sp.]
MNILESDPRVAVDKLQQFGTGVMTALGCQSAIAAEIAEHLVDADLCGVYSHGIFRLDWYAERAAAGKFDAAALPVLGRAEGGGTLVDGGNNLGMPAFRLATDHLIDEARARGVAAVAIANVDHTGRIGAFVKRGADAGCLTIMFGGGSRKDWRQVAPYGGARAVLPTNPYAFGIPGGAHGPVVIDFATGMAAGGKIYAAKMAGRPLAEGLCTDAQGRPTTNPDDYFNGGAILPMAGPKGYGMALVAELLGEAILGQAMDGMNWIGVAVDLARFRAPAAYRVAAEECLAELRACPPAPGFERVEVPGEREASMRTERLTSGIPIPPETLDCLRALGRRLGLGDGHLLA